ALPEQIQWMSTKAAAGRMGITTRTLYRFIDDGELRAYRFGRVIRLQRDDVDKHIENCLVEPGSLSHLYPDVQAPRPVR
ncbi:MAG TPA: hypothetical protein DEP66_00090, partial [Acidimicrobiaceae bacterium]|nr:hypothetical protein [Acidimicrobiaceae bacterium]